MKREKDQVFTVAPDIVFLDPRQVNPRTHFDEAKVDELAASIKAQGQLQPALVRGRDDGEKTGYFLVYGERRWRACKKLGIPLRVELATDLDYKGALLVALIENLEREGLSALEEAIGLQRIQRAHELSQRELAKKVGKSQAWIGNRLRLLDLTPGLQDMVAREILSFSAVRDHLLPFRSLREDLRTPFYDEIADALEVGTSAPEELPSLVRSVALGRSRSLSRYRGDPAPLFDAETWYKGVDDGAPKYEYDPDVGPEVRCFDVEAWERAQARAGRAPEPAPAEPAPEPEQASTKSTKASKPTRKVVMEQEPVRQTVKDGVLLVDTSGGFQTHVAILPDDLTEKSVLVEHTEGGPLVWWTLSRSQREAALDRARAELLVRVEAMARARAAEDIEKVADAALDVRFLQELIGMTLAMELAGDLGAVTPAPGGTGFRLLLALNEIAWAAGLDYAESGQELLPWWKQRPPGDVSTLVKVLIRRFHREGAVAVLRTRNDLVVNVRQAMLEESRAHLWSLVGPAYE